MAGVARPIPLFVALVAVLGCASPWDRAALERRHPALAEVGTARLAEGTPYVWPGGDQIVLLLCRWDTRDSIPVALPEHATEPERALLLRALTAWEGADLGVRFDTTGERRAAIVIRFGDGPARGSGRTGADCAVDPDTAGADPMTAGLVFAIVTLWRSQTDFRGHEIALDDEALLGSAVHELGHALGFQGHARRGATAMVRTVDSVKRIGRRLLAGGALRDDALRALYRVPSGTILGRHTLAEGATSAVDRLASLAAAKGMRGPFVRVGDRGMRIAWLGASDGNAPTLYVSNLPGVLEDPSRFAVRTDAAAASLLAAGPE